MEHNKLTDMTQPCFYFGNKAKQINGINCLQISKSINKPKKSLAYDVSLALCLLVFEQNSQRKLNFQSYLTLPKGWRQISNLRMYVVNCIQTHSPSPPRRLLECRTIFGTTFPRANAHVRNRNLRQTEGSQAEKRRR